MATNTIPSPERAINFLNVVEKLKTTPRTGWVKRGVNKPESIADHMYRMSVMALLVQGTSYDYTHCIKLTIVHDIAESIAGDITPVCGISDSEKFAMESAALAELKSILGGCIAADEIEELWQEYEKGETENAKLVKDFDKIEMIMQASEYEGAQGLDLQEFFDSTAERTNVRLLSLVDIVVGYVAVSADLSVQGQCSPPEGADVELARYIYELAQNRNPGCEPGGNYIADPSAEDLKLTTPCWKVEDKGNGAKEIKATYSFIQCDGEPNQGKLTNLTLAARVIKCPQSSDVLLQPMNVEYVASEPMPKNFTCPDGFEMYGSDFADIDFTKDWEFAHVAENAFKYNLSLTPAGKLVSCNSYLGTAIDIACINSATREYLGYATLTAECVNDDSQVKKFPIFVKAQLLGNSPLEARRDCPWPELLPGSLGYNANFTFTQNAGTPALNSTAGSSPAPAAAAAPGPSSSAAGAADALECLQEGQIEFISKSNGIKYDTAKEVWNKLNETSAPLAVAYPKSPEEVQAAVKCLSKNGIQAVPRSGGHSYEGFSVLNGAVSVDLSNLNSATYSDDKGTVTVGGGMRLGPLYYKVVTEAPGKVFPAGSCPAVGVGGFLMGGGLGFLSRKTGVSCDQIISLKLVDATGALLEVSKDQNSDLFWASCGGGGGNFGIVTEYTLALVDIPANITRFEFTVDSNGAEFMMYLQSTVASAADPSFGLVANAAGVDAVSVTGMYPGPVAELESVLAASKLGPTMDKFTRTNFKAASMPFLDFVVKEAYMGNTIKSPSDLLKVDIFEQERIHFKYKSFYVLPSGPTLLTKEAYAAILAWSTNTQAKIDASGDDTAFSNVEFNMLGPNSAVASRASDATAYPYRDALFVVQYGIEWQDGTKNKAYLGFIDDLQTELNALTQVNPPAYVNYIDSQVALESFYGPNFDRLQEIKTAVDPGNYFQNPMTIPSLAESSGSGPTPPEGGSPAASSAEANFGGMVAPCICSLLAAVFTYMALS